MIRTATVADREGLLELATLFLREAGYPAADPASHVDLVLAEGVALVIDNDGLDGFFAFLVGPHPITGVTTAFELGWYVRPSKRRGTQGIRLERAARALAATRGAVVLQVTVLEERLGRFLESAGYEKREITYIASLP